MTPIGYIGEQRDLLVRQGADFETVSVTYLDAEGEAVNLTGCTFSGTIKKTWGSASEVAVVDFEISDPATDGKFTFSISHEETAKLIAASTDKGATTQYVWQADITDAANNVKPLYYGNVIVQRDLTP